MKQAQKAHILTLTVDNQFGVLTRITAQVRSGGWNIKSLAAQECLDPTLSRITLALACFDTALPAIIHRLNKLTCVHAIAAREVERDICRELAVFSIKAEQKEAFGGLLCEYGARLIGARDGADLYEITCEPERLDAFLNAARVPGELNVVRTGPVVLD